MYSALSKASSATNTREEVWPHLPTDGASPFRSRSSQNRVKTKRSMEKASNNLNPYYVGKRAEGGQQQGFFNMYGYSPDAHLTIHD